MLLKNLVFVICVFLGCPTAFAHQDDGGDVHPIVRVEDGRFAVYFRNNVDKESFKSLIAANGEFLSRRQKSQGVPEIKPPVTLPEDLEGIEVPAKEAFYTFPEWERKHQGKPFMVKIAGQQVTKIPLEWGDSHISMIHGAGISKDTIVVSASGKEPNKERENFPFMFHSFDFKSAKKQHSTLIGEPVRIYWFPQASNVVMEGGFAYVAWMGYNGDGCFLNLSRFDPASGKCVTHKISNGWGNSTPSMGIINDSALICFHKPVGPSDAEISYERRSLSAIFEKDAGNKIESEQPSPPSKSE